MSSSLISLCLLVLLELIKALAATIEGDVFIVNKLNIINATNMGNEKKSIIAHNTYLFKSTPYKRNISTQYHIALNTFLATWVVCGCF